MAEIKLRSKYPESLKPIIESALELRLRGIEEGIKQTQERLQYFESKYHLSTADFLARFESGELQHRLDMEFDEWMGEAWMLERLQEKKELIKEIEIID